MSKIIESLKINAVYRDTTKNNIIKALEKYAVVSNITFEKFETMVGGKYNRVFIDIEKWHNTEEANEFIKLVHSGTAHLNYWWSIEDNTKEKKEYLLIDEALLHMDKEYTYDDGVKAHRYEWKNVMSNIYGGYGIENI